MAYKQKYKGLSKKGKSFTISLSEEDIKSEKSASPEKAKEISYEGQGGIDYENDARLAINPEGQGGKDYSDYENGMSRKSRAYLSGADVERKQKKADKKFSKVNAKNSDKKNLRKAKAGLKAEKQIMDKKNKDSKKK